jgi:hypothetical protein
VHSRGGKIPLHIPSQASSFSQEAFRATDVDAHRGGKIPLAEVKFLSTFLAQVQIPPSFTQEAFRVIDVLSNCRCTW